jgi:hypothetical protein
MSTRLPILLVTLILPVAAAAQTAPPPTAALAPAAEPPRLARWLESQPTRWFQTGEQAQAQAQPRPAERPPRRPSMVGYINDAGIQSQVRLRFDAGTEINAGDRAEFFYPKCGCYRQLDADHPARDLDAPGPGPGIATELSYQQFYLQGEYAFRDRVSVYGELPIRWLHPEAFNPDFPGTFDDHTGISDLRLGAKLGLMATETGVLTLQVQGTLPTGDGLKGLGVEHFSFEPALLFNQAVNDRVRLEGQFGVVLPAGGSDGIGTTEESFAGKVLYYGFGPSVEVYRGEQVRFAPVLELVGWRVIDGYQTATLSAVDGINIVNLKIGGRFVFRDRSSVYLGYGRGLTDDVWYHDVFRLEYRHGF